MYFIFFVLAHQIRRFVGPWETHNFSVLSPHKESFEIVTIVKTGYWIAFYAYEHFIAFTIEEVYSSFGWVDDDV